MNYGAAAMLSIGEMKVHAELLILESKRKKMDP